MEAQYELLKQFVSLIKMNPEILHEPKLAFFRDFLESLGANIPPKADSAEKKSPEEADPEPEPMEEDDLNNIPYPELDQTGVIEPDSGDALPMGDISKEVSDDDLEKANEARDNAMTAFSGGNYSAAVEHYTNAITLNPGSAILHGKRAYALIKMGRPVAAIADCDKAISINPDSAQGYKFRGRANALLGKWIEAHTDLATACKLDYDDLANEWLKATEPNTKKLQEYNRAVAREKENREIRDRRERVRRAQEANKKAAKASSEMDDEDLGDFAGGMPGGMGGLGDLFKDPELAAALKDPEVLPALMDIMQNPQNLMKYMNNPKIMQLIGKLQGKAGMGGGCPSSGCEDPNCEPKGSSAPPPPPAGHKAPEPDLD